MSSDFTRPTFLTILCFLTFVSSVSGLWYQSNRLWNPGITADEMRETFEQIQEKLHTRPNAGDVGTMDSMFEAIYDQTNATNIQTIAVILLIFESLSLYAAYLMWNLQKRGFYLYLAGVAVAFFAPLLMIGGWFGIINAIAGVFFSIFMVVFYAFNLKHLY